MSENGEQRDNARADTGPKWVWLSTEESVERGTISVLACAEVAVGIWLYWWVLPWWLETNLHLLISVLVAPLLLLRSPASVEAALAAFERYYYSKDEGIPFRSKRLAFVMLFMVAGVATTILVQLWLHETWLSGHDRWSLIWHIGIFGIMFLISVQIGIAVFVAGAEALVGFLAGIGAVARAKALLGPGMLLGIWLRSVIVRIGSTIRRWKEGWRRLSENWRTLVWAHDLRRPPELLPGIERHPELHTFRIRSILNSYKSDSGAKRVFAIVEAAISLPIFYLPALLYRFSLKSTCWFWWPLVFSQTSGRAAARAVAEGAGPGVGVVFEENSKTWLAKLLLGLSLAILVAAIGVPERLLALLPVSKGSVGLLDALDDMVFLMLPCAGVQLALFLLCDLFLARAKSGHLGSWPRTAFRWLVSLRQFLLWSALFAALALYLENWVPVLTPFAEFVETHYFSLFPLLTWT